MRRKTAIYIPIFGFDAVTCLLEKNDIVLKLIRDLVFISKPVDVYVTSIICIESGVGALVWSEMYEI